ncbi:MAG: inorganic diphosphatase, partial [Acidimicrobiales bacterium]
GPATAHATPAGPAAGPSRQEGDRRGTNHGMQIEVVVEIPKGTRNKYETDGSGAIWLDRMLFTSTRYPEDYGFVPHTIGLDGDPLDALVLLEEPTFPGCHIKARPIGVFEMRDEEGVDAKILCVPSTDPRLAQVSELENVPSHLLEEIAHFFTIYKALEPGKRTEPGGWKPRAVAETTVEGARARYQNRRGG